MPTIFLLFTLAILQIQFSDALSVALRNRNCWIILCWQLLLLPAIVSLLLYPWLHGDWYIFAVVSMCTSSITATTALAKIFGLNDALALVVCLAGTIAMPLPLFFFLNSISTESVDLELQVYLSRILVFIFSPFVLVYFLRRIMSASADKALSDKIPSIVLVLLMFFGLSVMDGVQALMFSDPWLLFSFVLLAFSMSVFTQLLTYFCLQFIGNRDAKAACLLCAYRNMGMVAAIAGASLGEYFLIFVGVWQLPMYTLPLLLKKFYQVSD